MRTAKHCVWRRAYLNGDWRQLVNPGGNGQGVLTGSPGGSVGLAWGPGTGMGCNLLRVGTASASSHTITATEAAVDETFATSVTPSCDAAGNMTNDGIYKYKYDAWNRLVEVDRQGPTSSPQVIAQYAYDGLGRRIKKVVSNSGDKDGTQYFYHNNRWQLLEIDNAAGVARQQFVWGTNYIDEAVCMDVDTGADGDCTDESSRHFFYMQDGNWNVTGLREDMGSGPQVVERYEYDPYGAVRIYRGASSAGMAEQRTVTGQSLKWLDASLPENPFLYTGYFYDSEIGKYQVRNRQDDPILGRWIQRDPAGYADCANLYQYVRDAPIIGVDPQGTRLQYSYRGIWVSDDDDVSANRSVTRLLQLDVEDLLWKYGINAWNSDGDQDTMIFMQTRAIVKGTLWNTTYDLKDLDQDSEWRFLDKEHRGADDAIVFVPGSLVLNGDKEAAESTYGAHPLPSPHVIGVARARFEFAGEESQVIILAHEILHHFLQRSINPNSADPAHDTQGIMEKTAESFSSNKWGCLTVRALIKKGVSEAEIDQSYVIK